MTVLVLASQLSRSSSFLFLPEKIGCSWREFEDFMFVFAERSEGID
jgi:hypothetical protein